MGDKVKSVLDLEYVSLTEAMYILDELDLKYTRQGLGVVRRSGRNNIFQYDAIAFGSKFFRKEKMFDIIRYICDRKGEKRSERQIVKAYDKVIKQRRKDLN